MKRAIPTAVIGFLAVAMSPVFATSTGAQNRVATAASACATITGTATYSGGGLRNDSTIANLIVDCPLGYSAELFADSVYVAGVFRTNGQNVSCTVYMEENMTGAWASAALTYSGTGVGRRAADGTVAAFALYTVSPLHAYCVLPPKHATNGAAMIYGFETDGTNP